ncbi:MAG TPA: Hsp20 family protein [Steroidobacteraceae bacterium]|jgi:HSP20 family molecular chaperone IbpA
MTRVPLFSSPLLLGFDRFERTLDRMGRAAESYPPYNIEQLAENRLRITLAVAGFGREDLEISLEANQLTIRGKQTDQGERVFLHRGIAARQFQRSFLLADGLEIAGAELNNGLLEIDVLRPEIEVLTRKIPIRGNAAGAGRITVSAPGTAAPQKE